MIDEKLGGYADGRKIVGGFLDVRKLFRMEPLPFSELPFLAYLQSCVHKVCGIIPFCFFSISVHGHGERGTESSSNSKQLITLPMHDQV